jgi:phage head maturation protease
MQIGAFDGLSIGFEVTKAELDEKKKLRTITDVELYEISPVSIPAIAGARVQDVKSRDPKNIFAISRSACATPAALDRRPRRQSPRPPRHSLLSATLTTGSCRRC